MNKKIVIITGAGRGIGKALAIGLSRSGYSVVATGRNVTDLQQLETRLPSDHLIQKCDITVWEDCQKLIDNVIQKYGQIDVLINNAGGKYVRVPLLESTKEDIDSVFDTQVKGTAYMIKLVLDQMAKRKSGKIYTITYAPYRLGLHLIDRPKPTTLHTASLFGKAALADLVAIEAKNYGVASIPVFIRWVASEMDIDDPEDTKKKSNHPLEVVNAILKDLKSEKVSKEIFVNPKV
jgi:NAD(P)-dependent dehydrogenase (short-subunit alcohol dehydrogenase family)